MQPPLRTIDFEAIKLKLASPEKILDWSHGEVMRPETVNYRTQKPEKDGLFCEKIFGPSKDWECYCGKYKKIRYKGIICEKCGVEVTRSLVRRERMGHIKLMAPTTHIWFLRGMSSKIGLALNLPVGALEKVIYFANFVITEVDEELKQATIEQIKQEFKNKKKMIENEFNKNSELRIKNSEIGGQKSDVGSEPSSAETIEGKKSEVGSEESEIRNPKSEIRQPKAGPPRAENPNSGALEKIKNEKMENLEKAFKTALEELKEIQPLAIISEQKYQNLALKYGHIFEAGIGAEAILKLLQKINLKKTIAKLEKKLENVIDSKKEKLIRRLKFFKSLSINNLKPEWMVLSVVPVIPPDLRPMVPLDGGRFATSDLNDLYRRVISRNNRLKQLMELNAPEVICRNEKRMLQEAVDALIDNSARRGKTVTASTGQKRMLKSLADVLKGKQGRFRQNLLGKRVDYSGRSVIVINPKLKIYQCGLPKKMALELFKPFVISRLIKKEIVHNVRSASHYIEKESDDVWDILEDIIKESYVLLNRAPTLHRLGIQAFQPILIEGKAIQIHPLVCTAFNADFDGDQMAVHVPLTKEAVAEARDIMLSSHNLLKPATGDPVVSPSQDIVWGVYYLTDIKALKHERIKAFSDEQEAILAYENRKIFLQEPIKVKVKKVRKLELIETTVGRVIFNSILPPDMRFANTIMFQNEVKLLIKNCLFLYGQKRIIQLLDELKELAFKYITKSGLSWGIGDLPDIPERDELIEEANKKVDLIQEQYEEGLLTDSERYSKIVELWTETKDKIVDVCKDSIDPHGSVYSMIESGARGSWAQLTQIIGMKGLVTSPSGSIIELPVKGNFKKGFDVLEYFISTHGVRKGLSDTALRTANAGYLTRRLIDVAQDIVISAEDCGAKEGIIITKEESEELGITLAKRIVGRYLVSDLYRQGGKGKALAKDGELVTEAIYKKIENEDIQEAHVRSVLNCQAGRGVCAKCYGYDLSYNKPVQIGTAVGIMAAQSIGEPGTQLTMRTFHTGGVAGQEDITQGLPRVEEIFEVRPPKRKAFVADVDGVIKIETMEKATYPAAHEQRGKQRGKTITSPADARVIKIIYKGLESDKYYFSEAAKELLISKQIRKRLKPKILVKDEDKVKRGQVLFTMEGEDIKTKHAGTVKLHDKYVKINYLTNKAKEFIVPRGYAIWVNEGAQVTKGTQLTEGSLDLQQYYILCGRLLTEKYIIREIQYVYSSQGQPLNDKHIEIIVRQLFSRVLIKEAGDTELLPGEIVEKIVFDRANKKAKAGKKKSATGECLLLGITKTSLTTDSFLSAASFQETARVLIDAAITGKVDHLEGLKENVIIGRLIPAGTGFKAYERMKVRNKR